MKTAIYIGPSKGAIKKARSAILGVLKVKCDEKTKRVTLKTLANICTVNNTTVTGCSFESK